MSPGVRISMCDFWGHMDIDSILSTFQNSKYNWSHGVLYTHVRLAGLYLGFVLFYDLYWAFSSLLKLKIASHIHAHQMFLGTDESYFKNILEEFYDVTGLCLSSNFSGFLLASKGRYWINPIP